MRDALSILDQALSLSQDQQVTLEIAEEITGSISLRALDDYVASLRQGIVSQLSSIYKPCLTKERV